MILHDEPSGLFTLHTRATAYQMKVDEHRVLLHTYYGPNPRGAQTLLLIFFIKSSIRFPSKLRVFRGKRSPLVQTEHNIHTLHRGARSAFT